MNTKTTNHGPEALNLCTPQVNPTLNAKMLMRPTAYVEENRWPRLWAKSQQDQCSLRPGRRHARAIVQNRCGTLGRDFRSNGLSCVARPAAGHRTGDLCTPRFTPTAMTSVLIFSVCLSLVMIRARGRRRDAETPYVSVRRAFSEILERNGFQMPQSCLSGTTARRDCILLAENDKNEGERAS